MTDSILEPSDFREILAEEASTPHLADLIWATGDLSTARMVYQQLWLEADPEALVTLAILDQVSSIPNRDAPLQARAREIVEAAARQAVTGNQAQELLLFLSRLAAFRLRDFDESMRISLYGARYHDLSPLPFTGLKSAGIAESLWRPCLLALIGRAEQTRATEERIRRLLLVVMLGAEFRRMDLLWYERLARCAKAGTGPVSLYFLLSLLDLCGLITSEAAAADARNYLHLLAEAVGDERERLAYHLRYLEYLAFSGSTDEALKAIRELADQPAEHTRPYLLQKVQSIAFAFSRFAPAASTARTRACETTDTSLRTALLLQAEELLRNDQGSPEELVEVVGTLREMERTPEPTAQGILGHASAVLQAMALQAERDEQLASLWEEPVQSEDLVDRALRRVLHRREDEELVPQADQVSRLLDRLGDDIYPIARRAALSLVMVGDGWEAMVRQLGADRLPEEERDQCRRLQAYTLLFRLNKPEEALPIFAQLFETYDYSRATLWGLWEAARRTDMLETWHETFAQVAERSSPGPQAHLFRTLEAASLAASGQAEEGYDLARHLSEIDPGSVSASVLAARLLEIIQGETPIHVPLSQATVPRIIQATLGERIEQAEQELALGNMRAAGQLFTLASVLARDENPDLVSSLLVRAGNTYLDGEVDLSEAEACFLQVAELDREDSHAWRGLCATSARAGRFLEVVGLVESRPAFLETEVIPALDLLLSARALRVDHDEQARSIYAFLLESGTVEASMAEDPDELDQLLEIARHLGQLQPYRDLLESLLTQGHQGPAAAEIHLRLGVLLGGELDDITQAIAHLKAVDGDPSLKERATALLGPLLEQGNLWDERLALLQAQSAEEASAELKVKYLLESAELLWSKLDRRDDAVQALNRVIGIDPKNLSALMRLAEFHREMEYWEKAVPLLEAAARLTQDKPRRSRIYFELGDLHQNRLDRPKQAIEQYVVSFMCDNLNREAFDRLDKLYTSAGRFKDLVGIINVAMQAAEQAKERSPYKVEELVARKAHIEYRYLNQPAQAAESLLLALTLNPSNRNYLKLLESYLAKTANPKTMLKAYEVVSAALPPESGELPKLLRSRASYAEQLPEHKAEAVELYTRILQLEPADAVAFKKLEEYYQEEGSWSDMIKLYEQQLDWVSEPEEMVGLHQRIASIYESELGDLSAATRTYAELVDLVPESLKAIRGLGRLYEAMRRWDDLIGITQREIELVDDNRVKAHLLFRLGSIHETHRGNEDKAVEYYEQAVQCDPGCVPALHGLRDIFQRRSEPRRVIQYLEQELPVWESARERASIHTRIGEIFSQELDDSDKAVAHLRAALDLVEDSRPALEGLLDVYFSQKAWADASPIAYTLSQHPEAVRSERKSELFRRRGIIADNLGNRREAIVSIEIALDLDPTNSKALDDLLGILGEESDTEAHAEFFSRLEKELTERKEDGILARVLRFLARQKETHGEPDEAVSLYDRVNVLANQPLDGIQDVVRVLTRMRRFEDALNRVQQAAQASKDPVTWIAANVMASELLLNHLDQRQRASELLDHVLEKDKEHRGALFLRAQAAYLDQDWQTAWQAMDTLVSLDEMSDGIPTPAERCEHLFYLGRILSVGLGDTRAALETYGKAQERYPLDLRPLKATVLLLLDGQSDRVDEALEQGIEKALAYSSGEQSAEHLLLAAKVARLRHMPEKAEVYLDRILALDPNNPEARALIVEVAQELQAQGTAPTRELHQLLESNVLDATALHGLTTLSLQQQQTDRAARYWRILELISDPKAGKPPVELSGLVDNPMTLTEKHRDALATVHPPLLQSGYFQVLRLVGPSLERLNLVSQPALPSRSQHLEPEEQRAVDALETEVKKSFGDLRGNIRVYREGPRGTALSVLVSHEPSILIEMACELSDPHQRAAATFLIAHAAELLEGGGYLPIAIPRSDLTRFLWWLSCWRESRSESPPREDAFWLDDMKTELVKAIQAIVNDPDASFIPLGDPQHAQSLAIELEQVATLDADRMGLIVSNHLKASIDCILKLETGFGLAELPNVIEELARSERIIQLLRYSVSEEVFRVRQLLL